MTRACLSMKAAVKWPLRYDYLTNITTCTCTRKYTYTHASRISAYAHFHHVSVSWSLIEYKFAARGQARAHVPIGWLLQWENGRLGAFSWALGGGMFSPHSLILGFSIVCLINCGKQCHISAKKEKKRAMLCACIVVCFHACISLDLLSYNFCVLCYYSQSIEHVFTYLC